MEQPTPKLTTSLACQVARIDRDRFNEAVAAGIFTCAPPTVAGRSRVFTPDDLIALWIYREQLEDGASKERAGRVACAVSEAARANPEETAISYVESYFTGPGRAYPASYVPPAEKWGKVLLSGSDVRATTTFNIRKVREMIAHYTAEAISVHGPED